MLLILMLTLLNGLIRSLAVAMTTLVGRNLFDAALTFVLAILVTRLAITSMAFVETVANRLLLGVRYNCRL